MGIFIFILEQNFQCNDMCDAFSSMKIANFACGAQKQELYQRATCCTLL